MSALHQADIVLPGFVLGLQESSWRGMGGGEEGTWVGGHRNDGPRSLLRVCLRLCGRAYDPAVFAAEPVRRGFPPAAAMHAAKVLECGAIATDPCQQLYLHFVFV